MHQYISSRLLGSNGLVHGYADLAVTDKLHLIEKAELALEHEFIAFTFSFDHSYVEKKIYLDYTLSATTKNKDNVAMTGAIDYVAVHDDICVLIDWKSGKYKEYQDFEQLKLYAVWVAELHPNVEEFDLIFYYVESEQFNHITLYKRDIIAFKYDILCKIDTIEQTQSFLKTENKHNCIYCPYKKYCEGQENG